MVGVVQDGVELLAVVGLVQVDGGNRVVPLLDGASLQLDVKLACVKGPVAQP